MNGRDGTRREFAKERGIKEDDLNWAFYAGYMRGRVYKEVGENE
jgi:hypothetical protein